MKISQSAPDWIWVFSVPEESKFEGQRDIRSYVAVQLRDLVQGLRHGGGGKDDQLDRLSVRGFVRHVAAWGICLGGVWRRARVVCFAAACKQAAQHRQGQQ